MNTKTIHSHVTPRTAHPFFKAFVCAPITFAVVFHGFIRDFALPDTPEALGFRVRTLFTLSLLPALVTGFWARCSTTLWSARGDGCALTTRCI
jgi:hypothetical protein